MIKVVVDSASSITPEVARSLAIHILPVQITFGSRTFLDGVDLDAPGFYELLRSSPTLPVTSQPAVGAYLELFRELTADGSEVLCITLSSELSGANCARDARRATDPRLRLAGDIGRRGAAGAGGSRHSRRAAAGGGHPGPVGATASADAHLPGARHAGVRAPGAGASAAWRPCWARC